MKALAGPAMLLVVAGGIFVYKAFSAEDTPSREFLELELAAEDEDHTGTCYSLSTVLIANGVFGSAVRTWTPAGEQRWMLMVENVRQDAGGPRREFQEFTFAKYGAQVRLVDVQASDGYPTDVDENINRLLRAPHARKSTPVDRCGKDGGSGYQFTPRK